MRIAPYRLGPNIHSRLAPTSHTAGVRVAKIPRPVVFSEAVLPPPPTLTGEVQVLFTFDLGKRFTDFDDLGRLLGLRSLGNYSTKVPKHFDLDHDPKVFRVKSGNLNGVAIDIDATFYDYAEVCINFTTYFTGSLEGLRDLSVLLHENVEGLLNRARRTAEELFGKICHTIVQPSLSTTYEDYFLFQIDPKPIEDIEKWRETNKPLLTQILRGKKRKYSGTVVDQCFESSHSYCDRDFFVIDKNAALLVNSDDEGVILNEDLYAAVQFENSHLNERRIILKSLSQVLGEGVAEANLRRRQVLKKLGHVAFPFNSSHDLAQIKQNFFAALQDVTTANQTREPDLMSFCQLLKSRIDFEGIDAQIDRGLEVLQDRAEKQSEEAQHYHNTWLVPIITAVLTAIGTYIFIKLGLAKEE